MTTKEKINKIYEVIWQDRNVGNEHAGDFIFLEVFIWDVLDHIKKKCKVISCSGRKSWIYKENVIYNMKEEIVYLQQKKS